jgi:capsular polysaccharide export protein
MKILVYIDCLERMNFFLKVANKIEYDVLFVTNKLSVCNKLNKKSKKYLIKDTKQTLTAVELPNTLSTVAGYHTQKQAKKIYASLYIFLQKLYKQETFTTMFIWNGSTTFGYTMGEFCKHNSIDTVFFEIANLDGKVFADPKGVNAKSYLYEHTEMLDNIDIDQSAYNDWLVKYTSERKGVVKQAKNRLLIRFDMILDYVGYYFLAALREDYRNPLLVIKDKILNRLEYKYEMADLKRSYIFFPLQVSNDSQLFLNSDYNNIDVLKELSTKYADETIYIKVHPAEPSREFIQEVTSFTRKYKNIFLVGNNTKDLIQNSKKVVVINSTVGLESLILKKEVEVYGRALYQDFDQKRLKAYIQSYLINIDYFDESEAPKAEVEKIINLCKGNR